ncbi:Rib/alpha-like domain-containing protein [Peptoniphilus harei]|uniref:Rib/alpha-like domain-containing protein n=1 Tax=Peptoniphilus harei TaxID=54005 RepID=UPI00258B8F7C|nr:Rib/alpha-like domain-containing protein [Peptoniphilus harei]MDU6742882.1 Rib/alpha-like domain-containing protein [Peptoniphilus harei]
MNRKIFSLVTSLAILTSSLSPTWAAGKDFTYNNLNQNLPIKAPVDETKEVEEKIDLPLVTETMPDESVRNKYVKIIFIPETKKINGVMEYGKLVDEYGNNIPTNENSSDEEKSKTFYVLKSAGWSDVLNYKEDGKLILPKLEVENNGSDPEKKKIHKFLGWSLSNNLRDPFNLKKYKKVSDIGTSDILEFKSRFENSPYFYGTVRTLVYDPDGYKVEEFSKRYNYNEFTSFSDLSGWRGQLSPNEKQKEFADPKDFPSKRIYFYFKKNSGTYKFGDYKPSIVNEKNNTFWYWCYDGAHGNIALDSFDMYDNAREFKEIFINKFFRIPDNIDFEKLPLPEGIFVVKLEAENGYTVEGLTFTRNAVRGGVSLAEVTSIPKEPELIDENNVKYEGDVAWYDGYKKINNPSEFKINSDIVLTARPVKDYESEKFTAQVKKIEVKKDEDVTLEKLKAGIVNLPKNLDKIEIKTYPDTSEVGEGKATLKLIFTDTSSKEVEVPVKVIEKISGGEITPIPTINDSDIIKEEVPYNGQINLLDNIKNLPDGAKVEDVSDTISTKVSGTYTGKVKVIFKDGSSRIVEIPIKVREALADSYTPQVKEIEVNKDELLTREKLKKGITNLPEDIKDIEIVENVDTSKVGKCKATLKLIFTDTSSKEVVIPVKVINIIDAGIVTPVPEIKLDDIIKEEVPYNGQINLLDNINNLPDGAEVQDISDPIDTKIPGTYTGKIKITFKDGSSRIVEIPIEVLTPMSEEFPVRNPVKTQVENLENINSTEKSEIEEKVREANPQVVSIEVDDRGNVTLIYEDGSSNLIKAEDIIILREKTPEEEDPEEKPGEEDNKNPEEKPGEEDEDPEVIPEEGDKDPEDKPGEVGDKDPEEKQGEKDNKDPEENPKGNEEEDNKKTENKKDSWNEFPRYYVRNHRTPTYKVETKITYKESKLQVNSKKFVINMKTGTYTTIEDGKTLERAMEVKPLIKDDRTFLPLRALADILDAKVIWNGGTRIASFTRDGLTALIQIDENKIVLSSGETIELESKPLNINGRIYLPLVNVAQVFGLKNGNTMDEENQDIEWDDMDKTVTINIK